MFDDEAPDLAIDLVALEQEPDPYLTRFPSPVLSRRARPPTHPRPTFIEAEGGQLAIAVGDDAVPHQGPWNLPPGTILKRGSTKKADHRIVEEGGRVLEATLAQHGVDAKLIGMTVGPTVTQYELDLGPGVKVNRVTGLSHDIPTRWRRPTCASSRRSRAQRDRRRGAEPAA